MSNTLRIFICVAIAFNKCSSSPIFGLVAPTTDDEFPFVVSIAQNFDITSSNPFGHTCGGALITLRYVLTAASCFLPGKTEKDYFVYVGSDDLFKAKKIEIESWVSYECWLKKRRPCSARKQNYTDNDIAVVKLSNKVPLPVHAAKLSNFSPEELEGENVKTAGWGLLYGVPMQYMRQADLRVISRRQCLQNVRNVSNDWNYSHEGNFFCTNAVELFAVLNDGDKGSPVFVKNQNGAYEIVGVNQEAAPSVNEVILQPYQQNKHSSVIYYMDFIKAITRCFT